MSQSMTINPELSYYISFIEKKGFSSLKAFENLWELYTKKATLSDSLIIYIMQQCAPYSL